MQALPIYVINLDRRPDRLEEISARLSALGLSFSRIEAVDAKAMSVEALEAQFAPKGPLGRLGAGDMACTLSHVKAMRRMLEDGAEAAIILEDDMEFAADFAAAAAPGWIPEGALLVKLETYLTRDLWVLLGREAGRLAGRPLRPLLSRHAGGGAYAITAEGARKFLAALDRDPPAVPIDHLLFNANVAPTAALLHPLQLEPSVARQRRAEMGSDIGGLRKAARPTGLAYWRRETIRGYYEIRLVPRQILAALFGGARLVKPRFDPGAAGGRAEGRGA